VGRGALKRHRKEFGRGLVIAAQAWIRWDARSSRLNRDFEVARIDYEFQRRLAAADYEANRRRNSS